MYTKPALVSLVRDRALKFGDFTLASGKKAKYYLDGKQVTLDAQGARLAPPLRVVARALTAGGAAQSASITPGLPSPGRDPVRSPVTRPAPARASGAPRGAAP